MPYIARDARAAYDAAVDSLFSEAREDDWRWRFETVVLGVAEAIYGTAKTRYWLQNEFAGVLGCCALEWDRRVKGAERRVEDDDALNWDWRNCLSIVSTLIDRVVALIPREDHAQRPGHFNYFLTRVLLKAIERGYIQPQTDPSAILLGLQRVWYAQVTGPYEDSAIATNGDCFPPDADWLMG